MILLSVLFQTWFDVNMKINVLYKHNTHIIRLRKVTVVPGVVDPL